MPKVIFIEASGASHEVEVPVGISLMRAAIDNSIEGIDAECGGSCSCATCHVYVDAPERLSAPDNMESDMLEMVAADRKPGSRLSCQLAMRPEMDGITIRIPETQY